MKQIFIILFLMMLIVVGTVSADTLVIYPTDDQDMWRYSSTGITWADIRGGVGTSSDSSALHTYMSTTATGWGELDRTGMGFNLSALSGKTITGVVLSMYDYSNENGFTTPPNGVVTNASPANWAAWVTSDYNTFGQTIMGNISYASWDTDGYNNITFTADGIAYFNSRAGTNASIMWRNSWDVDNSAAFQASKGFNMKGYGISEAGTSKDPFVTITYNSGGSAPVSSFTLQKPLYRIPGVLQVNDTSTNTPTQWNWSWGDGTWTNGTTQNATHKYTTRGAKSVLLLSSNAFGSNTTPTASTVRIVGYASHS